MFGVPHPERSTLLRVFRALAGGMRVHAPLQIIRDSGVEAPVGALEDIDNPSHVCWGRPSAAFTRQPILLSVGWRDDSGSLVGEQWSRR